MVRGNRFSTLLFLGVLLMCGCGGPSSPTRLQVSGEVTLDGKLVEKGSLTMIPAKGTNGPTAGANISNGSYSIAAVSGPVVGEYAVRITARRRTGRKIKVADGPYAANPIEVDETVQFAPPRYNEKTELKVQINPDKNKHDFHLTSGRPQRHK